MNLFLKKWITARISLKVNERRESDIKLTRKMMNIILMVQQKALVEKALHNTLSHQLMILTILRSYKSSKLR